MSNQEKGRPAQRRASRRKTTSLRASHGGSRRVSHRAQRDWNRKGSRAPRFSRLRSALNVIERSPGGHHVVAADPEERSANGTQRRHTRRSSRGRQVPSTRGRRYVREDEEDLEEVQSTSRRRAMRPAVMESGDKIEIEVGAVKALSTKYGIYRGATWMVILSLLLWWVPVLGPAAVGYIGGRKSGGPIRAAAAALVPIGIAFATLAALSSSMSLVPLIAKQIVTAAYQGFLGWLPFDFPIVAYIFTNLGAIMTSGPDVFFTVLGFAVVGGAVTQMKIHERSVPPITARVPKSRIYQGPARAYQESNVAVEDLVDRLGAVLARAEGQQRRYRAPGAGAAAVADMSAPASSHRLGWFRSRRVEGAAQYPQLQARRSESELIESVAPSSRHLVNAILSSTPPGASDRRARAAVKAGQVDLDLPTSMAFASPAHPAGIEGLTGGHNYRPSKLYHIYGSSVNPVARAKLEKRLRRTHTIHTMRRAGHSTSHRAPRELEELTVAVEAPDRDPQMPRSLESSALLADVHYDAMEHLENATWEKLPRPARKSTPGEDELGGLIAHIGEGGEAVVDGSAVEDVAFERGPVFDKRGRQRARIAADAEAPARQAAPAVHAKEKAPAPKKSETIDDVEGRGAAPKTKVAHSADRSDLTAIQKEKVDRWLKHTLADTDLATGKHKAKAARSPEHEPAATHAEAAPAHAQKHPEREADVEQDADPEKRETEHPGKVAPRHREAVEAPAFEITHGSTEVDAEAGSLDEESKVGKPHKTASQILREIRLQKRAEEEGRAQAEAAKASKQAKREADEIERSARESIRAGGASIALSAQGPAERPTAPRRRRSEDFEAVVQDSDKLSGDLELTLSPIREDAPVEITEVTDLPAHHAHHSPSDEGIPMVGVAAAPTVTVSEALEEAVEVALKPLPHEVIEADVERTVKAGDVVLAGPSTDLTHAPADEAYLSDHDHAKVAKRMQEGWNRL